MMSNIPLSHPLNEARGAGEKAEARQSEREIDQVCHRSLPQLSLRGDRSEQREGDMWKAGGKHKDRVKSKTGGTLLACDLTRRLAAVCMRTRYGEIGAGAR